MSRPLCWSFSIVKQLELWSACFGRYCRNWLTFTALQMYSWQLKMVYCKLHLMVKMVSCKVMMMMKNKCFNCNNFNICSWSYGNYPVCWHQMYPHINKSTWPKCRPDVKLMLYSVTFSHQMPILVGLCLTECQSDPKAHQMSSWHLTGGQSDPKAHQMSRWPDVVLLLATRCLYWGGLKLSKWHGIYAAVLLGSHSTPTPCFRTLCLNLPVKNQEKSS